METVSYAVAITSVTFGPWIGILAKETDSKPMKIAFAALCVIGTIASAYYIFFAGSPTPP